MNEKVMVRFPQVGKDTVLHPAEVISRSGDRLRVKLFTETGVRDVLAADTLPFERFGGRPDMVAGPVSVPIQAFPTAVGALGNRGR